MGKFRNIDYINDIGIKETICHTNMGNTIYILNNGQKYKEYGEEYRDLCDPINRELQESLLSQTDEYGNSIISYPEIVITSDKELFGIVGTFELGTPLLKTDPLTQIDCLFQLIEILEQGIEEISYKSWNLEDLHEENILINKSSSTNPIRIIDTDYYTLQEEREALEIYRNNLKRLFNAITNSIMPTLGKSHILEDKDIKEQYILATNGIIKPTDFFGYLLNRIKISSQDKITIKTLQKTI